MCPEARAEAEPAPQKACTLEGLFAHGERAPKEVLSTNLFHRVGELLSKTRQKFQDVAASGKLPAAGLPSCRRMYADAPELRKAVAANHDLSKIVPDFSAKRSLSLSLDESSKVELLLKGALEVQSTSFWLVNALLTWIKVGVGATSSSLV